MQVYVFLTSFFLNTTQGSRPTKLILRCYNPLKTKLMNWSFKKSISMSKETQHFTIIKIDYLMMYREIIHVYEKHQYKIQSY
jgi:hypothetical protein